MVESGHAAFESSEHCWARELDCAGFVEAHFWHRFWQPRFSALDAAARRRAILMSKKECPCTLWSR
jgi:hypothetical protein